MRYQFLIETYQTEIEKVLSVWSQFEDADLHRRPHTTDRRGRSMLEHMVHQSVSENVWFQNLFGINATDHPLPAPETRIGFIQAYAKHAAMRLEALREKPEEWWEEEVKFFEVKRLRVWVFVRRIAHTAHHRGQQTALLRMIGRSLHSTYGPTADTGGLMTAHAPTIYAYPDVDTLLHEEAGERERRPLGNPGETPVTERPDAQA